VVVTGDGCRILTLPEVAVVDVDGRAAAAAQ
jgi:hypothetical protein